MSVDVHHLSPIINCVHFQHLHVVYKIIVLFYLARKLMIDSYITINLIMFAQAVQPSMIGAWLSLLTSEPRAAQLLDDKSPILTSLEQAFNRYLKSVAKTSYSPDKRYVQPVSVIVAVHHHHQVYVIVVFYFIFVSTIG